SPRSRMSISCADDKSKPSIKIRRRVEIAHNVNDVIKSAGHPGATLRLRPSCFKRQCRYSPKADIRVTALANKLRVAQGYQPVGREIGFTNRPMWDEYGAPNWGWPKPRA